MAYTIKTTKSFDKDVALCIKRGYPMDDLQSYSPILIFCCYLNHFFAFRENNNGQGISLSDNTPSDATH